MADLGSLDRKLIARLRLDGRASVTTLAADLGVSRGTLQAHLARLQENGTIRRFTVEVESADDRDLIHAVMLIEVQGGLARPITSRLRKMPQVASLHSTNGAWDLVANIETTSLAEFDRVLRDIREITGVLNSETCLLLDRAI